MRVCFFCVAVTLLLLAAGLAAADEPARRGKVGLVLSGGGARGAAHVGVLKYLEEQRIPVDFIAGTSVGAVIGGLYASGMSADEIERLIVELDWREMFSDGALPGELGIRRKGQRYRYLVNIDAGIEDGELIFSTGFIQGQRMMLMLREQTLPVRHVHDFDDLPTPFRAVATNLATADVVVFEAGDIVRAMRASMSVPGVYSPVEYDGKWLVDGGLVQNLPVPVALEAGMDTLIAVDVATPLRNPAVLGSPFAVTSQVIDGVMLNQSRDMRERLRSQDVLIAPGIEAYDSTAFDFLSEIIAAGYAQAAAQYERLERFSVSPTEYDLYVNARLARRRSLPDIARIEVTADQRADALVRARVEQRPGKPLDVAQLHEDLGEIYGLGMFESVTYTLHDASGQGETLVIQTEAKGTGPLRFETGFELQETFSGNSAFQLRAALNQVDINPLGAEWRTEIGLGTVTGVKNEFYQPVVYAGKFYVAANHAYAIGDLAVRDASGTIGEFRLRENVAGFDIGANLGHWSMARLGVRYGREDLVLQQGDPLLFNDIEFDVGDIVLQYHHDSLDSFRFPSDGLRVDLRWESAQENLGATGDGEYLGLDMLAAFGDGEDNILLGATFESVLSGERFLTQGVALGGMSRLSGFGRDDLIGRHAGLLRGVYYRYLGRDPDNFIDLPLYAGVSLEAGNVWQDSADVSRDDIIYGGSLFIALDTFIGPVGLAYGRNSDGKDAFYLSIGTINGPSLRQFRH